MANTIRVEKVSSEIERTLSLIIQHDVHDSRVAEHFGSITRIELTNDLKYARIYVSVFGDEEERKSFMEGLASARGFIRSELGKQTTLRYVPELQFKLDRSFEEGSKVISLLEQMRADGKL